MRIRALDGSACRLVAGTSASCYGFFGGQKLTQSQSRLDQRDRTPPRGGDKRSDQFDGSRMAIRGPRIGARQGEPWHEQAWHEQARRLVSRVTVVVAVRLLCG